MTGLEQRPRVETNILSGRLHEAVVLYEYGESASGYVKSQLLSKAFEAIGLSALTITERPVDDMGRVIDFDGRPMVEKTQAALDKDLPDFERSRRESEDQTASLLDELKFGQTLIEDSMHPEVADALAVAWGYNPNDRFMMKRLYRRTQDSLVLYNFNIRHGMGPSGINRHMGSGDETIEQVISEYDDWAERKTGIPHFLGEIWTGEAKDYGEIERRRLLAEQKADRHLEHFKNLLKDIGGALIGGEIDDFEASRLQRRYERGFHTLLLVELNPERARLELSEEDYLLMQELLRQEPVAGFGAAYDVAERNRLIFIACGDATMAEEMNQEWYGSHKTIGRCVNCKEGPKEVGEKSWCQSCIKGHCG